MDKRTRDAIAATLIEIAERHGATVQRRDEPRLSGYRGPSIRLDFALADVAAMMSINDLHGGDGALIHWYTPGASCSPYAPAFTAATASGGGWRPHHKATSSGGWDDLARYLDAGLAMAAAGTAKSAQEPAHV